MLPAHPLIVLAALTAQEVGPNDFRISAMGIDGASVFEQATDTAVAYNPALNEYLVVWSGLDNSADGREIYAQRIDAGTGLQVGPDDLRVSDMGPDGVGPYSAALPDVAFNPHANEYLVVWVGAEDLGSAEAESEVFAQRLDALGNEIGVNDMRISSMGPDGSAANQVGSCAVAYNANDDEYLVVWDAEAEDLLANLEYEIWGQRLSASGNEIGIDDFRISDMGPDGRSLFDARRPDVAWVATNNTYAVVWEGNDIPSGATLDEFEIYGQALDAAGTAVGPNDFRISVFGPPGDDAYRAQLPAIAHDAVHDVLLVVWEGLVEVSFLDVRAEVYGRRVDAVSGALLGVEVQVSSMGDSALDAFIGGAPAVTNIPSTGEFLVAWNGNDGAPLADAEFEIYAQRIHAGTGAQIGTEDLRVSDLGTDGVLYNPALTPAIAAGAPNAGALIAWEGEEPPLATFEYEVFGQLLEFCAPSVAASEIVRLGSPPNPSALQVGQSAPPALGLMWDPRVDHGAFMPRAIFDVLAVTTSSANLAGLPAGTLLCDPATLVVTQLVAPGDAFAIDVPYECSLAGASVCAQAISMDAVGTLSLTNALDIVVGTL